MHPSVTSTHILRLPLRWAGQFTFRPLVLAAVLTTVLTLGTAAAAHATINPATTIDASPAVIDFGDAAMAADGSGAVVYRKLADGIPHVFVARFTRQRWYPSIRVDQESPFAASVPRIAAAPGGRLIVVWAQAYATLPNSKLRYRLMSASLAPGASAFGPQLAVDGNVGAGSAIDPSVAITPTGRAYVAYRVVLSDETTSFTALRQGDVLEDVRVGYLDGRTWSPAGVANRNRSVSTRKPSESNAPQIAATPSGNAVVAWQEPDLTTGVAHVYARRVFGGRLGNLLAVSPDRVGEEPIQEDADGIAVAVSTFGSAIVGFRVAAPASAGPDGQAQLMVNTLPLEIDDAGARFQGARAIGAARGGQLGVPAVSLDDDNDFRVAFGAAGGVQLVTGGLDRDPGSAQLGTMPAADEIVTTIDPSGGGTAAWPAVDATGGPAVAVRQDFPTGAFQTAIVGASRSGPINGMRLGSSGRGDALVGFGQGATGSVQIAAAIVKAPPADFILRTPDGWVTPRRARIGWEKPVSAFGGLTYDVAVDGIVRQRGHRGLGARLDPRGLDDGAHDVQVIATDGAGQQTATVVRSVKIDVLPPTATVRRTRGRGAVLVTVSDAASRVRAAATRISFGDGTPPATGRARARHVYARPGRHQVRVVARDRVGHVATIELIARVR
jgi:hypothetical protein